MMRLVTVLAVLCVAACDVDQAVLEIRGETMGTTYTIVAVDKTGALKAEEVRSAVEKTLADVNATMSNWDPNSEISRFNAQQGTDPVAISDELALVMGVANEVHVQSLGRFDVTLGPLIELWGFGTRNSESPVPSDGEIAAARQIVGQSKVLSLTTDPPSLRKTVPEATVFLAAIAKGYGVDRVAATLREQGLGDYMVEIGGEVVASGKNPKGEIWSIGIERPDAAKRTVESIVRLPDMGMATSGDYRNYFEENGVRYSHIIDSESGRPITHLTASVTVIAENAMLADGWATALLALGKERGLQIANEIGLAAFFIVRDVADAERSFVTVASERFVELQGGN
ncbi:FAD:protein FMN transferase [Nisaea acidiphila]|uniref:FAD:protein FMN transferase n=1 Tax=Nisaea acidiphila TaxID=1862145 RepID=A0A9J7APF9_9PROT|nr:FAD:protein FMN transferase [Nisaea acidiphila]UUX49296.1 FAD:protein FMN transferase [Nisaea acidiphila]